MDLDVLGLAKQIFDAVMGGHWALVAAAVLMLAVYLLRKFGAGKIPFLATDAGGALTVLATSELGALANALAAGQPLSWGLVWQALSVGFAAAGGWAILKKALLPAFDWALIKVGLKKAAA